MAGHVTEPPNNEMQLTRPVQAAASQLISSVRRTAERAVQQASVATWLYASAGLLAPLVFWASGPQETLDSFSFWYVVVPLAAVSAMLAGIRRPDATVAAGLEAAIAAVWAAFIMSIAGWKLIVSTVQPFTQSIMDQLAMLVGIAGVGMCALAVLTAWTPRVPRLARGFRAAGLGILGLYLGRASAQLYMGTRVSESTGIGGMVYEGNVRVLVGSAVIRALAASTVLSRRARV
jgi:hypothetical protein